ncbi:MAG: hypothetical protein AB8H79_16955 [Myxococcota bacterium]
MRWLILLMMMSCYSDNWSPADEDDLGFGWDELNLPMSQGDVVRSEPDRLVVDFPDQGSSQRQRLYKGWYKALIAKGWAPVESYGDLSTGKVRRANFYKVDDTKHGLLEVTRRDKILRVSVRKTTVGMKWEKSSG